MYHYSVDTSCPSTGLVSHSSVWH